MTSEATYLFSGILLGLSGGLSPGPLMTLVITQTLKYGIREGAKISIAPLLTDAPIIAVSIGLLSRLTNISYVIGAIYMAGGLFLAYLGYESITFRGVETDFSAGDAHSVQKGVMTNFLNPSPYLFWLSVGSPMVLDAYQCGWISVILFICGFYVFLVASKLSAAVITGKSRIFLKSKPYVFTIRILGVLLFGYFICFFYKGLEIFGVV